MWFPLEGEIAHLTCLLEQSSSPSSRDRRSGRRQETTPVSEGLAFPAAFNRRGRCPSRRIQRDCAVRQFYGIPSVFGFILSGPGLDGVGDPVMKYPWL
jgi:hypothetical protein